MSYYPKKKIYNKHQYFAYFCINHKDESEYYTVVNMELGVHRHYPDRTTAINACRHAATLYVPEKFSEFYRHSLLYLITGDVMYKGSESA